MKRAEEIDNPLFEFWKEAIGHPWWAHYNSMHRDMEQFKVEGGYELGMDITEWHTHKEMEARRVANKTSWAVPGPEALDAIAAYSPIVEIGAGRGYWAWLLRQMECDVLAYDIAPPGSGIANQYHQANDPCFTPVFAAEAQVAAQTPGRALLLVWPPYSTPMAYEALQSYQGAGGRVLLYVGEGSGGCNGDEQFWELLESQWREAESVDTPQFFGLHDYLRIYRR